MTARLTNWYQKSFRNKLVTVSLGIFILVYFSTLHWAYSRMSSDLLAGAKKESVGTSAILVMALYRSFELETDKREILSFLLGSKKYRGNIMLIRVIDMQQAIVSSTKLDEIGQISDDSYHQNANKNQTMTISKTEGNVPYLKVFYPISAGVGNNNNRPVGYIETDYDISSLTLTLANLRLYFIVGGLLMALGITLALTKIASTMTKPISQLYEAMKQVEDNRLTIQVAVTSKDEIGFLSNKFNHMIESLRQSHDKLRRLVDASRQFVPFEFLQMLGHSQITEVNLGDAQHKSLNVLFLDIRDFTRLSSSMTADQVLAFLNKLNQYLLPHIQANNGFVDKYIGDAIMAIFPNKPDDAVNASRQLIDAVTQFNADRPLTYLPDINIGIGINCGDAIMGTVGTAQRMDTTVIGDTVNLASRMEGLTKAEGVRILLPVGVYQKLQPDTIQTHKIELVGELRVKGIVEPVETYGMHC